MTGYQTLMQAISQMPTGSVTWWLERVLIQGNPDGTIKGADAVIGIQFTDPLNGKTLTTKGPFTLDVLSVLSGQTAADWTSVIGTVVIAQQATIAARDAAAVTLNTQIATLTKQLADLTTSSTAQIAALTAQLAAATDAEKVTT